MLLLNKVRGISLTLTTIFFFSPPKRLWILFLNIWQIPVPILFFHKCVYKGYRAPTEFLHSSVVHYWRAQLVLCNQSMNPNKISAKTSWTYQDDVVNLDVITGLSNSHSLSVIENERLIIFSVNILPHFNLKFRCNSSF